MPKFSWSERTKKHWYVRLIVRESFSLLIRIAILIKKTYFENTHPTFPNRPPAPGTLPFSSTPLGQRASQKGRFSLKKTLFQMQKTSSGSGRSAKRMSFATSFPSFIFMDYVSLFTLH